MVLCWYWYWQILEVVLLDLKSGIETHLNRTYKVLAQHTTQLPKSSYHQLPCIYMYEHTYTQLSIRLMTKNLNVSVFYNFRFQERSVTGTLSCFTALFHVKVCVCKVSLICMLEITLFNSRQMSKINVVNSKQTQLKKSKKLSEFWIFFQ